MEKNECKNRKKSMENPKEKQQSKIVHCQQYLIFFSQLRRPSDIRRHSDAVTAADAFGICVFAMCSTACLSSTVSCVNASR